MSWYDDACRTLIDWLGIKARVVFIGLQKNCSPIYHELARAELPNAFFIDIGKCNDEIGLSLLFVEIVEAIDRSKNYLQQNTYVVMMFPTLEHLPIKVINEIADIILKLNKMKARPVVLNFFPIDFMNKTNLYYDELILLSQKINTKASRTENEKKYKGLLKVIKNVLLNTENYDKNMLQFNDMFGNGPLTTNTLLFSQPHKINYSIGIIDIIATCILMYSLSHLCKQKNKPRKFKTT